MTIKIVLLKMLSEITKLQLIKKCLWSPKNLQIKHTENLIKFNPNKCNSKKEDYLKNTPKSLIQKDLLPTKLSFLNILKPKWTTFKAVIDTSMQTPENALKIP